MQFCLDSGALAVDLLRWREVLVAVLHLRWYVHCLLHAPDVNVLELIVGYKGKKKRAALHPSGGVPQADLPVAASVTAPAPLHQREGRD